MNARELARVAWYYLLSEGHEATWARCRCYSGRALHHAVESTLRPDQLDPDTQNTA